MTTESKGIYHWKLGDVAMARMCKKVYARVRVIKNEKGLFFDDKGLYLRHHQQPWGPQGSSGPPVDAPSWGVHWSTRSPHKIQRVELP